MRRRSDFPVYLALRGTLGLILPLPRGAACATGAVLGRTMRSVLGLRRDVADKNLAVAFPDLGPRERAALAGRTYAHFGRVAVDSLRLTAGGARAVMPFVRVMEGEALLEAMALGVPVVASRAGGNVDLVTHEVDGLLVAPREPAAFAGALARLLGDAALRRRLGEQGRRTARERFPLAATAVLTEAAYRAALAQRR